MSATALGQYAYLVSPALPETTVKAPGDILDYLFDFSAEFGPTGGSPGNSITTISALTVSPTGSLAVATPSISASGSAVLFWASSGAIGQIYTITCSVITNTTRQYTREGLIPVGIA